jgi:cytidine deaminase
MKIPELLNAAARAMKNAYAPYSNFPVGAAVYTKSGKIYSGCNMENASLGLTICAERAAIAQAICAGEREFEAIAIISETANYCRPCGACRQVIAEFGESILVLMANNKKEYQVASINLLLPSSFNLKEQI